MWRRSAHSHGAGLSYERGGQLIPGDSTIHPLCMPSALPRRPVMPKDRFLQLTPLAAHPSANVYEDGAQSVYHT